MHGMLGSVIPRAEGETIALKRTVKDYEPDFIVMPDDTSLLIYRPFRQ
jgi:hypothetical protein